MHKPRLISVALAVAAVTAVSAASASSASRVTGRPLVPTSDGTSVLARTPRSIVFGCCDPPTFAGTRAKRPIRWKSWTQKGAIGTGAMWVDPCRPDCAAEGYRRYPATILFSDPRKLGVHRVFREMSITYTTRRQIGWLTHATVEYKFLTGSPPLHGPIYFFKFP